MAEHILTRRLGEKLSLAGMLEVEVLAIRDGMVRFRVVTDVALPVQRVSLETLVSRYWRAGLEDLAKAHRAAVLQQTRNGHADPTGVAPATGEGCAP